MTVTPSAPQAHSMAFSVAPTLGMEKVISQPARPPAAEQWSSPPCSRTSAPRDRMAARWRSMGLGPSSHPPGKDMIASPSLARMAPRKMTDERISRIRASGTSRPVRAEASTVTVSPARSTRHPRCSRMAMEARTSERSGQLCTTLSPGHRMVAARMGSTLFFAPWTRAVPWSRFPPSTR